MLLVVVFLAISATGYSEIQPLVQVEQGWLLGATLNLSTGFGTYYSFKGIPYAKPPNGTRRFKAPECPDSWDGLRNATEHGSVCPQYDIITNTFVPGNEDCLFLNVYTKYLNTTDLKPVIVFIHGGGYKSGSGNVGFYGPDFLVTYDIVLVTINYRLDALGFLCLDTPEVPGNAGLRDQAMALKWVKSNIAQFGGNPDNVTIIGESAGGASVGFHIVSPMSENLFHRAILMSGVPNCDWSISFEPRRRAFVYGKMLGIDTKDPNELLQYLQSLPTDKLVDIAPVVLTMEILNNNILKMYPFTPVIEKDLGQERFLGDDPAFLLQNGSFNQVDILVGYTSQETLVVIPTFESSLIANYNRYYELFVPRKLLYDNLPVNFLKISDMIRAYYFGNKSIDLSIMKEFVRYTSDSIFTYDVNEYMQKFPKLDNKNRYLYKFSCTSERNIFGVFGLPYNITGASHLDDLMYLFDAKDANLTIDTSSRSFKMVEQMCTLFTNFAKYGNPTPDDYLGVTWEEFDDNTKSYMNINETLTTGYNLDAEIVEFWKSMYAYTPSSPSNSNC